MRCTLSIISSILLVLQQLVSGQQCGTVGRVSTTRTGDNRVENEFYINRGNRAGCAGMITSLSYCFHRPPGNVPVANEYLTTVAVYRPASTDTDENVFMNVSSPITIQKSATEVQTELTGDTDDFVCSDLTLDQPVAVLAGDVLGACVFNPPDRIGVTTYRLDIVSRGNNEDLVRTSTDPGIPTGCGANVVPSSFVEGTSGTGRTSTSRSLHLWANIELVTEAPTTGATTMEATTVTMESITIEVTTPSTTTPEPTADTTSPKIVTADMTTASGPLITNGDSTTSTTNRGTTSNPDATTPQPIGGGGGGSNVATIAIAVVVVLIIVVSLAAVTVIVIILVSKRLKKVKKSYAMTTNSVDNQLYSAVANAESLERAKREQPLPQQQGSQWPTQSQEHVYEFEGAFSPTRSMESTYAEVGPFGAVNDGEIVYESPLDAPAISYNKLLEKNKEEDIYVGENPYETPASRENDIYAQLQTWRVTHLNREDIKIAGHLGSGQFGSVEQGVWKRQGTQPVDVALKSLTKTSEEDKVKFLQEAAIMAQFRHPNVIMLHGVVTSGNPIMIVVEMAKKGDLRQFLLSLRPDPGQLMPSNTLSMLLKFSQQVALGMQYLSAKGFVHRDLAARNVLLTTNSTCKVADFGLSRDLNDENYYVSQARGMIPVKWTAPEALHYKKYSTASDVWAYGCLLFEIWSIGHKPFEGMSNQESIRLIDSGKRLSPPPGCPKMIFELMILCWHPESSQRLVFRDVVLTLVGSEKMVLSIPEEDSSTNPLAGVLGAPLEAGKNMYSQLQNRYIDYFHGAATASETDGDYFDID
ncbi:probable LIM domain-containing serine/threonine-protein kinase DDB_G0287001 isoform X2 [Halichondria panicea]|uniref:probable LIM domain-containing serine/threonine-protein kinase DDB_G0287001 isoform X2 n=1 Tax=Halichondria panicea TaxID=6063 RepID=UPI00312B2EF8